MKKELVLLGAGASRDAGVPITNELTKLLVDHCAQTEDYRDSLRAIRFAVGGLIFHAAKLGGDPYEGVNAESLFNAIELLSKRQQIEASPFISSWSPEVDTLEHANADEQVMHANHFFNALCDEIEGDINRADNLKRVRLRWTSTQKSDDLTQPFIDSVKSIAGLTLTNVFEKANDVLVKSLADIVWKEEDANVDYLLPLVRVAQKSNMMIASLNYDNCIELAAAREEIFVNTGINSWNNNKAAFKYTIPSAVNLLKLHGSIDWAMEPRQPSRQTPAPDVVITTMKFAGRPSEDDFYKRPLVKPGVIFGGRNKLTAQGPFLDLFRKFQSELNKCEVLVTIGYSFNDAHVNAAISHWLNSGRTRHIKVISGENFDISKSLIWQDSHDNFFRERLEDLKMRAKPGIQALYNQATAKCNRNRQ